MQFLFFYPWKKKTSVPPLVLFHLCYEPSSSFRTSLRSLWLRRFGKRIKISSFCDCFDLDDSPCMRPRTDVPTARTFSTEGIKEKSEKIENHWMKLSRISSVSFLFFFFFPPFFLLFSFFFLFLFFFSSYAITFKNCRIRQWMECNMTTWYKNAAIILGVGRVVNRVSLYRT